MLNVDLMFVLVFVCFIVDMRCRLYVGVYFELAVLCFCLRIVGTFYVCIWCEGGFRIFVVSVIIVLMIGCGWVCFGYKVVCGVRLLL